MINSSESSRTYITNKRVSSTYWASQIQLSLSKGNVIQGHQVPVNCYLRQPRNFTERKIFRNALLLSTLKMRLPQKRALRDDSNDTPQPMWVEPGQNLYSGLGLACIILILSVLGCGVSLDSLNEPVFRQLKELG